MLHMSPLLVVHTENIFYSVSCLFILCVFCETEVLNFKVVIYQTFYD